MFIRMPKEKSFAVSEAEVRHRICLQDQLVVYELRRSNRRSIGFRIDDQGLRITVPHRASQALIDSALHSKQRWILDKLEARRQRPSIPSAIEWKDGSRLLFMGQDVALTLVGVDIDLSFHCPQSARLFLNLSPSTSTERIKAHLQKCLQEEARSRLGSRLQAHAARMSLHPQGFSLSSARSRWGSCTAAGHVRLNWRLIHLAPELADYVMVHELAHLREMNHSPRFWALVAAYFPKHRQARKDLRERGQHVMHLFEAV